MRDVVVKAATFLMALVLGVTLTPANAEAQSHADLVWRQLNRVYENVASDGYSSRNYIIGRMDEDASDSWTFSLTAGMTYRIVGACDGDCSDLDIEVLDGTTSIAKDVLADDIPVVTFRAAKSTRYTVKVIMAACSSEPCFFGIGIFQK